MPIFVFSPLEYSTEKRKEKQIYKSTTGCTILVKFVVGEPNSYLRGTAGGASVAIALSGPMFLALEFTRSYRGTTSISVITSTKVSRTLVSGVGAYNDEEALMEGKLQPKCAEPVLLTRET